MWTLFIQQCKSAICRSAQSKREIPNQQQLKGIYISYSGQINAKKNRLDDESIVLIKLRDLMNERTEKIKMCKILQITRMTCVVLCIRTRSCWWLEKPEVERVHRLLNTSWRQVTLVEVLQDVHSPGGLLQYLWLPGLHRSMVAGMSTLSVFVFACFF